MIMLKLICVCHAQPFALAILQLGTTWCQHNMTRILMVNVLQALEKCNEANV